jgi:CRP-like cAMP-binding protein
MIGTHAFTLLRNVQLLAQLEDAELASVWEICRLCEFGVGSTIMKAGESGVSMYFFLEGSVEVWPSAAAGRKPAGSGLAKPLVRLKAGTVSLFGEMAMLSNEGRSATITASSDCILYEVTREDFTRLCDQNPQLGVKLLRGIATILADRVRKGNDDQIKLWKALAKAQGGPDAAVPVGGAAHA